VRAALEREHGTASLELVLVAPALLLLLSALLGAGRLFTARAALEAVAREAGRTAAAAPASEVAVEEGSRAAERAAQGYGLDPSRLSLSIDPQGFPRGGTLRVVATYRVPLGDLPLLGIGLPPVTLRSVHLEPIDPYKSRWS